MRPLIAGAAFLSFVTLSGAAQQPAAPASRHTIKRHFVPADRRSGRYQYVPVVVGEGVTELTIALRFNDGGGASVIDLGLFQPGPLTIGTPAFRGYSGGATRTVTIARDRATPGYLSGPIPPGEWHVLLGLYKVAPDGVDVELDVDTSTAARTAVPPAVPAVPPPPSLPDPRAPRWFSGGLHLHTVHSDGTIGPNALAAAAHAAGLEFIAITDHNNTTHAFEPADSTTPLRIVGEEITTPAGHANAWGLRAGSWIDFRVTPDDAGARKIVNELVATAHAAGALFSINHPVGDCGGCSWEQTIPDSLDSLEIWNGRVGPQPGALAIWDRLLQSGRHVTGVGASDWHRGPDPIDAASVRVFAQSLTERDLLDAIRSGHVVITRNASDPAPDVSGRCGTNRAIPGGTLTCGSGEAGTIELSPGASAATRVDLVWNGASIASEPIAQSVAFALPNESGYARVHVYGADGGTLAITNPVYVERR